VRVGERWTTIPTGQWPVVQLLLDRMQQVVADDEVAAAYRSPNRRAIRSMMHRLTKRLEEVGLLVHKVRGRGYLLEMGRPD
jgi:DNA-binding response OmpR family regulator